MSGRAAMRCRRTRQRFDELIKAGKSCEEIAAAMGRSLRWAQGWRRKLYGSIPRSNAVNKAEIDRMIIENRPTREIMAELRISKTSVMTRRSHLSRHGLIPKSRQYVIKPKLTNTVTDAPLIPPEKRLERALPAIVKRFPGKDMLWIKTVWIKGTAGRNFMAQGGYL